MPLHHLKDKNALQLPSKGQSLITWHENQDSTCLAQKLPIKEVEVSVGSFNYVCLVKKENVKSLTTSLTLLVVVSKK